MSIVDEFPYPIEKPPAQELLRVMAALFRTEREAILFTGPFGVDPADVTPGVSPKLLWFELLRMLASDGQVRPMVQAVRDQFPNNPRRPFFDDLLANRPTPASAEPLAKDGPGFDDSVSKPEALLFFDDLTMPAGKVPNLLETLTKVLQAVSAVCLLKVENEFGSFFGTGFRIGPGLVLSNHHVLFPKGSRATKVQADFGFDVDVNGASLPVVSLAADPATINGEKGDDWAVVKIDAMKAEWPVLSLDGAPAPKAGDLAYILQHPGGQQKRLGFVRNMISDVTERTVCYLTDTEPGSSGAPVFDTSGRVIALHHAGGRPVEVLGKPPVAKNEGIRISRVLSRLKAANIVN